MIVAGTGHRPHKLGGGIGNDADGRRYSSGYDRAMEIRAIRLAWDWLRTNKDIIGIKAVISGMAMGWDQALAEAALFCKIPLLAYLPCRNMHKHWTESAKNRWLRILCKAEAVFSASKDDYVGPWCMQKRNEMMVDDCNLLLALWDGSDGGTSNCMGYAISKRPDLEIINLWPEWEKLRPNA